MNASPAERFFFQEAAAHARQLPLHHAVLFLRGLLQASVESPLKSEIHQIYLNLSESDKQLELFKTPGRDGGL